MSSGSNTGAYGSVESNVGASTSAVTLECEPTCIASGPAPNRSWKPMYSGAFFRDARICPDGTCALALADDRSLSLFALPNSNENSSTVRSPLSQVWNHEPSDSLLSYDWYPGASSTDPSMFAFAVGVKDHPVHLLDGHDQRIRASYPIIDHTERFVAPNSMRFSPDGTSLYCGFDNAIEILDVSRPGEAGFRLKTTPNRTSRTGQKGLISALDFSPSEGAMLLAAGSFSGTIGLYDPSSSTPLSGILRSTHRGGVTQVKFHPTMPHLLFVASRQADYLEMFDLRNLALDPIRLERKGRTNQRIGFDIDPTGEWLMTGDQNGTLSFFDTSFLAYTDTSTPLAPTFTHSIRSEPIGAAMFHPDFSRTRQILTCTGTRTFDTRESSKRRHARHDDDCSNDSDGSSDSQDDQDEAGVTNVDVEVDSLQLFAW